MITISTGGIGHMDIMSNSKPKGASKEEEKAVDAFASLMNMVSTRQEPTAVVNQAEDVDVSEVATAKDKGSSYEAYKAQEKTEVAKDSAVKENGTSVKGNEQVEESAASQNDNQQIDDGAVVMEEVKTIIKDALGITDEELETLLADMGIQLTDLAVGDNLKNFILHAQNATNVDLIVNEDLANLVTEVTSKVEDVIVQNGFENVEEFQQFVIENKQDIEVALQDFEEATDISISDDINLISGDSAEEAVREVMAENSDNDSNMSQVKADGNSVKTEIGEEGLENKIVTETATETKHQQTGQQSADSGNNQIAANFSQAIDNAVNTNLNVDASAFVDNIQEADIIRQIIEQIKVNTGRNVQSMEVQLNPENLGKVYVNVEAKDGVMQAKIIAETEAAKNAIENNLAVLKENFSNQELKVEAIEVMVATYDFFQENANDDFDNQEQSKDTSKSIGGININDIAEEELTEEEELEVEIMKAKGNTVSYTV